MSELKNIHSDGTVFIGAWQNVVILDVGADVTLTHTKLIESAYRTVLADYPDGIAMLVMIRVGVPIASAQTRAEGARATKALGKRLLRVAIVIEERGVVAQLIRSVMRGVNVIVRQTRLTLFDTIEDAIAATLPVVVPATTRATLPNELQAAVEAARRNFRPSPKPSPAVTRWF